MNKPKMMISQPMADRTEEEIVATREKAIKFVNDSGYEFVNTLFTDKWCSEDTIKKRGIKNKSLYFLVKSLENMALCDAVYFCSGWYKARGCKIEHEVAEQYGLKILHEE